MSGSRSDWRNQYAWGIDTFVEDFKSNGLEPPSEEECECLFEWMYDYIDENFFDWSVELLGRIRRDEGAATGRIEVH